MAAKENIEEGLQFTPQFDENGLIPAIAQDAKTGQVLMAAYMNQAALDATIQTGCATYFSRSRKKLWRKGEESGHVQKVEKIHVGYQSCFYRALKKGTDKHLELISEKVYDPKRVYKP